MELICINDAYFEPDSIDCNFICNFIRMGSQFLRFASSWPHSNCWPAQTTQKGTVILASGAPWVPMILYSLPVYWFSERAEKIPKPIWPNDKDYRQPKVLIGLMDWAQRWLLLPIRELVVLEPHLGNAYSRMQWPGNTNVMPISKSEFSFCTGEHHSGVPGQCAF